ncbi:Atrial natriuretic peptide receptor 2 [Orchesella cincta]|uniref:guanylate cyclase n=1 Tax=Orchesella cincta TaxID=48709 RepID=A0A1D2NFN8_ORCCI|nr:Atrial natriuretic peptide receptor 2 [Orchesella cincta]
MCIPGKLWTAPEILRVENPPPEGTQKGDVYSFAIIVHEIAARQGSFYTLEEYRPEEIVTQLKEGKYTRPTLEIDECNDELIDLMEKCWAEDPLERPDFGQIKQIIRRLNK